MIETVSVILILSASSLTVCICDQRDNLFRKFVEQMRYFNYRYSSIINTHKKKFKSSEHKKNTTRIQEAPQEIVQRTTMGTTSSLDRDSLERAEHIAAQIIECLDQINERFDRLDERFDRLDERFDRLDERFDRLDERFDRLDERFDRLEGVQGKKNARNVTVKLMAGDSSGHGMVFQLDGKYLIITAAHVAISLYEGRRDLKLKPIALGSETLRTVPEKTLLFVPLSYIKNGKNDIGILSVAFVGNIERLVSMSTIEVEDRHAFDIHKCFARLSDFNFQGHAVEVLDGDRVRLTCHSKHGCGGTPMFSESGKLHSVLHGKNKHREKNQHLSADNDAYSLFVYVDAMAGIIGNYQGFGMLKNRSRDANWYLEKLCDMEKLKEEELVDNALDSLTSSESLKFYKEIMEKLTDGPRETQRQLDTAAKLLADNALFSRDAARNVLNGLDPDRHHRMQTGSSSILEYIRKNLFNDPNIYREVPTKEEAELIDSINELFSSTKPILKGVAWNQN